nr:MAG TPA: hypothetical protein [Caudoviricetes sp.]
MNDLFQQFGGNVPMPGGIGSLIQQFNQFRANFQGNPQQQVQQLLSSGKMSQEQFNQLAGLANQFQRLL